MKEKKEEEQHQGCLTSFRCAVGQRALGIFYSL